MCCCCSHSLHSFLYLSCWFYLKSDDVDCMGVWWWFFVCNVLFYSTIYCSNATKQNDIKGKPHWRIHFQWIAVLWDLIWFFSFRLKDERNVSKAEKERKNTIEIKGEKKRCWLCNQLHFMLFCTQRTSITVHSTSFSFIIFMMIWNHSSVFYRLLCHFFPFFTFFSMQSTWIDERFSWLSQCKYFFLLPFHCLRCST